MEKTFLLTSDVTMKNGKIKRFSKSFRHEPTARVAYIVQDGPKVVYMRLSCIDPNERTVTILAEKSR